MSNPGSLEKWRTRTLWVKSQEKSSIVKGETPLNNLRKIGNVGLELCKQEPSCWVDIKTSDYFPSVLFTQPFYGKNMCALWETVLCVTRLVSWRCVRGCISPSFSLYFCAAHLSARPYYDSLFSETGIDQHQQPSPRASSYWPTHSVLWVAQSDVDAIFDHDITRDVRNV